MKFKPVFLGVAAILFGIAAANPNIFARRTIITVNSGGDLQAAINSAMDGDEIHLEAGATFTGNYFLGTRSPNVGTVLVKTAGTIPNRRITPADASALATITSSNSDATLTAEGSNVKGWTVQGVVIGSGGIQETVIVQDADRITFDRVLLVAGAGGLKRGIRGNGTNITLTQSHIANVWSDTQDAQAFCAWDGAGPYTLTDNYLEASGENVMFGGANSASVGNIPADILVEGNLFYKPLAWKLTAHSVKNIFELKSAKRVTIRNNRFENNWTAGQPGYGIVITVRNDEGGNPWSVIEDVLFENNVVISEKGLNIYGWNDGSPSGQTQRVVIRNSLFITEQRFCQIGGEANDITFDHLTLINASDRICTLYKGDIWPSNLGAPRPATYALSDFTVTNTVMSHRSFGMFADEDGQGTSALNFNTLNGASGYVWTNNSVAEPGGIGYPTGTLVPSQATHDAQFADTVTYPLIPGSIYRGAGTNGSDLGWIAGAATRFRLRIRGE